MSLFSRISAATTAPAMRARGLRVERRRAAGGWSLRIWRKEPSSPASEPWLLLHGLGANAATWLIWRRDAFGPNVEALKQLIIDSHDATTDDDGVAPSSSFPAAPPVPGCGADIHEGACVADAPAFHSALGASPCK